LDSPIDGNRVREVHRPNTSLAWTSSTSDASLTARRGITPSQP
jgi:hypothetical protein